MVLMFTWVHGLVFVGLGGIAARLLSHVERHPRSGFGVLLFFVVFQFGFIVAATVGATPVLHALTPWSILVANLLAAATMTAYFRRRHPGLRVSP
jgi:O-antigen/teichoic acid export membrane protein